jgi:SAM-dependent methyltransferase
MNMGIPLLKQQAVSALSMLLTAVPASQLRVVLIELALRRARMLPPAEGLRFLLGLDASLYPIQSELAVAYGNGVHTKHRHMRYHDFFVARVHPGERVLDIGCGIGAVAYDVASRSHASVVGIDLNVGNIAKAKKFYDHPNVEYIAGDALRLLPTSTFDVVILSNVLEHLPGRPKFLQQVQNHIKPSRILIRVPLFERDWRVPLKKELGIEWRLDSTHETEYTLESFAAEIHEAGLKVIYQEVRWSEIWAEVAL